MSNRFVSTIVHIHERLFCSWKELCIKNNIRRMDARIVQLQKIIDDKQKAYENLYNSSGNTEYCETETIDLSQPSSSQNLSIFRFIPIIETIQEIYLKLYERNYKQIIADKRKIIAELKKMIIEQDNAYTELYYRPGYPGYLEAFADFKSLETVLNCCFKQKMNNNYL